MTKSELQAKLTIAENALDDSHERERKLISTIESLRQELLDTYQTARKFDAADARARELEAKVNALSERCDKQEKLVKGLSGILWEALR